MQASRRTFLAGLTAAGAGAALGVRAAAAPATLRVDAKRLQQTLEELSVFGRPAGGAFADGVSRIAYSVA